MLWMKRFIYTLLSLLVLAVVAILVARWWLLGTEAGTQFAVRQAQQLLGSGLSIESQRGTLGDGLSLNEVQYQAPGTQVRLQQLQLAVKLKLLPRPQLMIRRLHMRGADIQLDPSEWPTEPSAGLPSLASPVPVILQDLRITQTTISTSPEAEPISIDNLQAQLRYADKLSLQQFSIDGSGIQAQIQGESSLTSPFNHQLELQLDNQNAPWVPELHGLMAEIQAEGSLDELELAITTSGPLELSLQATLRDLLDNPGWELSARNTAGSLTWPPGDDASPQVIADVFSLTSSGHLDDHQTRLQATLDYPAAIRGEWQLAASGDQQQLVIEQLAGPVLQGRIEATGDYAWQSDMPTASLAVQLSDIKPALEQPELAQLPGVSGSLQVRLVDQLASLEQLNLRVPDTDWRLTGTGSYALDDESINADINWQQLNWPPQSGSNAEFASQQGQLQAQGSLADLAVSLQTQVSGQTIPAAAIALDGQLLESRFVLDQMAVQTLEGEIDLAGNVDWQAGSQSGPQPGSQSGLEWELAIDARTINPGRQWAQFPGSINLQATSTGNQNASALTAVLNIQQLDGTLRGQPLSGSGEVQFINGAIRTDGLQLRSGDAQLDLQGDPQAFQAQVSIPELGALIPTVNGRLELDIKGTALADGAISDTNLKLTTELIGTDLGWQDFRAESLRINSQASLSASALVSASNINITTLQLPGRAPIDTLELRIDSDETQQRLSILADHPDTELAIQLAGNWDQWPAPDSWQGRIDTLSIANQQTGEWQLRQPAGLIIAADNMQLERLCIERAADSAARPPGVCLQYQQQPSKQALVDLEDLPVAMFETFLNIGLRSDHLLSGQLAASWENRLRQLNGELILSDGELSLLARNTPPLRVQGGRLQLTLTEQQRLRTQLQLTIEDRNSITADVRYGPITAAEEQLTGTINLDMPDLGWLRKAVPELDRIAGELQMQATLSGPVRQPLIALDIELHDGEVVYQPLGLQLRQLELTGHSEPGETLHMDGGFTGGQGRATIQATLEPATRVATLNLKGENVQLLNSAALKVRISPDLRLIASPDGYQIAGELAIPAALISPPQGVAQRVTESDDVVLVGAGQAAEQDQEPEPVPVTGQLKLILGRAVQLDADEAKTNLTGELDLVWDKAPIPLATGVIRLIDGRVQAYGQNLSLEKSRVVYNDTPADNPRLEIQAVRKIFGDPQVEEAGVAITGPAQEPNIRVFTNPATSEESALAYIATGSNFDHANGQGALNLGIYLFPQLFVSYGLGLFDNGNTANARYEFSEHWNVSLQSGSRDTGVDLNWRTDG